MKPFGARRAALAGVSTGILLAAGCATPLPTAAPQIVFDSQVSMTPGMSAVPEPAMTMTMPMSSQPMPAQLAAGSGTPVDISNFAMTPAQLTVPVGTTVTWTNHDDEPHTVAAKDGSFHSPALDTNATYSFTFTKAGTYDYICSIHPFMTASVVVK